MDKKGTIDQLHRRYAEWMDAIQRRDLEAVVSMYAADGVYMAPGRPRYSGKEAIREAWRTHLARPGFKALYEPDLDVSASLDLAYDKGTYVITLDRDGNANQMRGKYVVVWKKEGGHWVVAVDIDNADQGV